MSSGCSGWAPMLQLCPLPAYVGNADMIQPDLAPLQPSLDDMEISGKSLPRCGTASTQPSMLYTRQQPKMVGSEGWPGSSRSCWGSQKAPDIHWHGKSSMHGPGCCGRLQGRGLACVPAPGAEPQQVGKGLAGSCGRGFLQTEGLSRNAKPPCFGCRQRKDNCPPQERGNLQRAGSVLLCPPPHPTPRPAPG